MRTSIVTTLLLVPVAALAQSTHPELPQTAQRAARPFKDATMTAVARLPEVSVLLSGAKGEKAVEANIGVALGNLTLDGKVKGPLDEESPDTNLATIAGLTNGTSFDVGVSYLHWNPTADVKSQNAICLEYLRSRAEDLEKAKKIGQTAGCKWSELPSESYRQQYMQAPSDARRKEICKQFALSMLLDPATFDCAPKDLPEEDLASRYDRLTNWAMPFQAGIRYARGRKKLAWADPSTGEAHSTIESPWEVGVGINVLLSTRKGGDVAVSLEYSRQSAFEEESKRDICLPIETTAATTCRSLPFGKYGELRRNILTGIVRKWIGIVAVDVRYNWDITNDQQILEMPVYFLAADGKGLTGGVVSSWSSRDSDGEGGWAVRAFIGDVISIFPRPR